MKQNENEKIRSLWKEEWKKIKFDDAISENEKYKISNYGRIINCKYEKEYLKNQSYINGYENLSVKRTNGKLTSRYVHKLVASHFVENTDEKRTQVLHLNFDITDNNASNLEWATRLEKEKHHLLNPKYKGKRRITYSKLNEGRVRLIKRKLNDPNRKTRMKMIAKQFGISEMQLYRIKTGENWGWVEV